LTGQLNSDIQEHVEKNKLYNLLIWIVVITGLYYRFKIYFMQLSIDSGEYVRLSALQNYSFLQILKFGHSVITAVHDPYILLIIQKFFIQILGDSTLAIRFIPFLFSCLSLLVFLKVKDWFIGPQASLLATGLLAFCPVLIIRTAILEPYSTDVFVSLIVLLVIKRMSYAKLIFKESLILSFIGLVCFFFSLPSIFILMSGSLSLIIMSLFKNQRHRIFPLTLILISWVSGLFVYYIYALKYFSNTSYILQDWSDRFLPSCYDPYLISEIIGRLADLMRSRMGIPSIGGMGLMVVGSIFMWRTKRCQSLVFLSTLFMVILASCMNKYPFYGRVLIFLIPVFILMMASGYEFIVIRFKKNYLKWVGVLISILIIYQPLGETQQKLQGYSEGKGMEPIIKYIHNNYLEGDIVYYFTDDKLKLSYYKERSGFVLKNFIQGVSYMENEKYIEEIKKLSTFKRVWVIFGRKDNLVLDIRLFEDILMRHKAKKIDSYDVYDYMCELFAFGG